MRLGAGICSLRVAYLSGSSQLGGAERVLLAMLSGIRQQRPAWELTVVLPSEGPLRQEVERIGVLVELVPMPAGVAAAGDYALRRRALIKAMPGAVGYLVRMRQTLRRLRPDIVHSNGFKMHIASAWIAPSTSRLLWHLHDYVGRRSRSAMLLRWSTRRCLVAVANSQSVADDAFATLRARIRPLPVLNGVDLRVFEPTGEAADLDQLAGATRARPGTVRVGIVATYARWKGHRTFLEGIAALPSDIAIRAYIVGGPVYRTLGSQWTRADLQAESRRLHLGNRVMFIDFVPSPAPVFRALDIVVHASTEAEPFGLVVAEAMACGRAVIAALDGGIREIVTPGVDALVHSPGSVSELAAGITLLARDSRARTQLGEAARLTAEARFGLDRFTREVCRAYSELIRSESADCASLSMSS